MKRNMIKLLSLLLVLCMVLPLAACGDQGGEQKAPQASVDAGALYAALQNNVKFDTDMADMSESAEISYAGLPAGAKVTMYAGNGYYADELTWVALQNESDLDAAMKIVEKHIDQLRDHFVSYQQADVPKIDNAHIWSDSKNIILCITGDETAKKIMDNPQDYVDAPVQGETSGSTEDVTDAPSQDETEPPTEPPTEAPTEAPTQAPTQEATEAEILAPTEQTAPTQASEDGNTRPQGSRYALAVTLVIAVAAVLICAIIAFVVLRLRGSKRH